MPFDIVINTRETTSLTSAIQKVGRSNSLVISLIYDSVASTFQFNYLYDPNNINHAEIAGLTHLHEAQISYTSSTGIRERVLTGFVLSQDFVDSPVPELLAISGYAKTGFLQDCDIPHDVPLEANGISLSDITLRILSKFKGAAHIDLQVRSNDAETPLLLQEETVKFDEDEIDKTTAKTSQNILEYLRRLAKVKNLVYSHDSLGNLVIKRGNTESKPILTFDADKAPHVGYRKMRLSFNGEGIHKTIAVIRQAKDDTQEDDEAVSDGNSGDEIVISNPFCPIVNRTRVVTVGDDSSSNINDVARNEIASELKDIRLIIDMGTVEANGVLITPDNTVFVKNKKLYLYNMTKWFIEKVDYRATPDGNTCVLTCVPPWCYNFFATSADGKIRGPYNFFIDPARNFPTVRR